MQQAGASPDVACEPCKAASAADCLELPVPWTASFAACSQAAMHAAKRVHLGAQARLTSCCAAPWEQRLLAYGDRELFELPLNDAYKPKMHNLYSSLYTAVEADFMLNVRRTPFPLRRMFKEVGMARTPHKLSGPKP